MLVAVRVVGGVPVEGNNDCRLMRLTVFEPVFATMAAPVASLIATPVGFVPVVTSLVSADTGGLLVKSMTEAVPLPWLATTARPSFWLMAMPCGVVPTEMGLPIN